MTEQTFVAPDTDDLDAFNSLMYGSAKPTPAVEEHVEEVDDADDAPDDAVLEDVVDEIDEPEVEPEPEPEPAKKKTAKERINELTAARKEAERLVEVEKAEKAALTTRLAELEAKVAAVPAPVIQAPKDAPSPTAVNEDGTQKYPLGEFDPNYIADLTRHTIETVSKEREAQAKAAEAQKTQQEYNQALQANWQSKVSETEKTLPDFRTKSQELIGTFSTLAPDYGEFLASTIMGLDTGPEVLYHLANNPSEAREIVSKGPLGAAIALGRLEARFTKSPEPKQPPRVSTAPKPAPQAARGVAVGGDVRPDTDDLDAFSASFFATRRRQ